MLNAERRQQQLEALELAQRLSVLLQGKEEAVACQDFELAVQLREAEVECRSRLHALPFPVHVRANLQRKTGAIPNHRSPVLEKLATDPGTADATIVEQWPEKTASPLRLAFANIPQSATGTLRAVLNADDIFSTYFEPMLPVLSAETITGFRPEKRGEVVTAMFNELIRSTQQGVPAVLSLVAPTTFLDAALQSILVRGLKETGCDFVIFEQTQAITAIMQALQPEIAIVQASSSQ